MLGAFLLLAAAIAAEVVATASLPRTDGFRDPAWSAFALVGYAIAVWLLALVVQTLPVSVTYAIWAGVGTAAIALIGVLVLGEPWDLWKVGGITLVVAGVVMLNLHGAH